jgi:cytochrome c553
MILPGRSIASDIRVNRRVITHAALAVAALASAAAGAADPQVGRAKAAACAVCHGQAGISTVPNAPHLAGQPAFYVEEQLRNYRSGKRHHEVMNVVAKPLSDADIDDLAAWYASIRIDATPP